MKQLIKIMLLFGTIQGYGQSSAKNYDEAHKLVSDLVSEIRKCDTFHLAFEQKLRIFGHFQVPLQTVDFNLAGRVAISTVKSTFIRVDSVFQRDQYMKRTIFYDENILFQMNEGQKEPSQYTVEDQQSYINDVSLFTPLFYLHDFLKTDESNLISYKMSAIDTLTYRSTKDRIVTIAIDRSKRLVTSIFVKSNEEMHGAVVRKILYNDYKSYGKTNARYPTKILATEFDVPLSEVVVHEGASKLSATEIVIQIPRDYKMPIDEVTPTSSVQDSKFNPSIHLFYFKELNDNIPIVEFKDYLLVIGAPVSVQNGELIIQKAKQIWPDKPIRYFAFGHHHPYSMGGLRAFVHNKSTIVCLSQNEKYAEEVSSYKDAPTKDELDKDYKPVKLELFENEKTISDGETEVRIYKIGELSNHANDFLIFYFPKYKLLFEEELVWIKSDGPIKEASKRQKGLYEGIKKYNLDVTQILQAWTGDSPGYKSVIPFSELEESINLTKK